MRDGLLEIIDKNMRKDVPGIYSLCIDQTIARIKSQLSVEQIEKLPTLFEERLKLMANAGCKSKHAVDYVFESIELTKGYDPQRLSEYTEKQKDMVAMEDVLLKAASEDQDHLNLKEMILLELIKAFRDSKDLDEYTREVVLLPHFNLLKPYLEKKSLLPYFREFVGMVGTVVEVRGDKIGHIKRSVSYRHELLPFSPSESPGLVVGDQVIFTIEPGRNKILMAVNIEKAPPQQEQNLAVSSAPDPQSPRSGAELFKDVSGAESLSDQNATLVAQSNP